jgi:hypothetical protein
MIISRSAQTSSRYASAATGSAESSAFLAECLCLTAHIHALRPAINTVSLIQSCPGSGHA